MSAIDPPPNGVVVLGSYRSGTSIAARVLEGLGVDFGPAEKLFPGNARNPGGFYERADVNAANTAFIESAGFNLGDPGSPKELLRRGDASLLRRIDLDWMRRARTWGLKDPRLCATLLAWMEAGLIARDGLRIVHVIRDAEATAESVRKFPEVLAYCGGAGEAARAMTERYMRLAEWHAEQLRELLVPVFVLRHHDLVSAPIPTARRLGEFIGVRDGRLVRRAARAVGKRRGLARLYAIEVPRRAWLRARARIRALVRRTRKDAFGAGDS